MTIPFTTNPKRLFIAGLFASAAYGVWLFWLAVSSAPSPASLALRDAQTPLILLYVVGTGLALLLRHRYAAIAHGFLLGQLVVFLLQGFIFGGVTIVHLFGS